MKKIVANQAEKEHLLINKLPGISSPRYEINFYVPVGWVFNPKEGTGVSATYVNNKEFQVLAYYAAQTSIIKVNKTNLLIKLEVLESYIDKFYNQLKLLENSAEIKLNG